MSVRTFLWTIIKPYKHFYFIMAIAPLVSAMYPILYSYVVKLLIDLFTKEQSVSFYVAFWPIFLFVLAHVMVDIGWRMHNFVQMKSIPYVFQRITEKVCTHIFHLPYTYFQNNLSGSIAAKIKGIGDNYYKIHHSLETSLSIPLLTMLFAAIGVASVSMKIFCFVVGFNLVYTPLAIIFFKKLAFMEQQKQDAWYYLFGTISDRIQNIFNLFSFATRKKELKNIQEYYRDVQNPLSVQYYRFDLIICIILGLVYWLFLISVFLFVIYLKNAGEISIGDIAFVLFLTSLFAENSWRATTETKELLTNIAAFKSAFSIMEVSLCAIDKINAPPLRVSKGEITFKNIAFQYDKSGQIFNNFTLHIKPGQKVAFVGHSGAGKSTLISLLLKNFKVTEGDILIDTQSIYDFSSDSLRANISLIPQDIMLFHRTIGENIGYANEKATISEIEQAAKMANIHTFITSLPDGYNTLVGERGIKLSGGQRQRIAIARAILKNAPILILDEATSSLDSETENEIQKSISMTLEKNNSTVIAIAHRLSTIKHMDRIIVLEDGKIMEDGTFEKLLSIPNGKFKEFWKHQANVMLV